MPSGLETWQAAIVDAISAYSGDAPIDGGTAIEVYMRNSIGSRVSALESRCPVLGEVLGSRYFTMLASRYVARHISRSPDLNRFGDDFPAWLQGELQHRKELLQLTYLPDLAALECAWSKALWVGVPVVDARHRQTNTSRTASRACIDQRLNPTLTLIASDYAIDDLWESHRQGEPALGVALLSRPRYLVVLRPPEDGPRIDRIDADMANLLRVLIQRADDTTTNDMTVLHSSELSRECIDRYYLINAAT